MEKQIEWSTAKFRSNIILGQSKLPWSILIPGGSDWRWLWSECRSYELAIL